jgi:hypothetical protein
MDVQATGHDRTRARGSWAVWTAVGVSGIWAAVILISLLTPHMVSGSHQERLPVAAFGTWLWGMVATVFFLWGMFRLRRSGVGTAGCAGLSSVVVTVWLITTALSIFVPVFVTGSDPTRIPIAGLVSPVAAMVLTFLASITAALLASAKPMSRQPGR